jgi:hypothetical protein
MCDLRATFTQEYRETNAPYQCCAALHRDGVRVAQLQAPIQAPRSAGIDRGSQLHANRHPAASAPPRGWILIEDVVRKGRGLRGRRRVL